MGLKKLESGRFKKGKALCEYSLNYLDIQEEYHLDGKISCVEDERSLRFNTTQKTRYSKSEIRTKFDQEIRFMNGLCKLLEREGLIPGN